MDLKADSIKVARKKIWRSAKLVDNIQFYILALPALLYFFIFAYLPMFGIVIAFQDFKYNLGFLGSQFIGFKNFEFFFTTQDFWRVTSNTIYYSVAFIVLGITTEVMLALALFEVKNKIVLKYCQTTMILPNFLSWIIVGYITYILFNPKMGVFNQIFEFLGKTPIDWYTEPKYWPFILTSASIWKGIGMGSIVYYAALMGISPELYEAAKIDGANKWHQIWHISIPSITPIMTILAILAVGGLFRGDFGLFYQVTRDVGVLYPTTDVIDTYIYRGLKSGSMGQTAAVGLMQSGLGLLLVLGTNFIVKKIQPENSLF